MKDVCKHCDIEVDHACIVFMGDDNAALPTGCNSITGICKKSNNKKCTHYQEGNKK
jgi:hypothetical protein